MEVLERNAPFQVFFMLKRRYKKRYILIFDMLKNKRDFQKEFEEKFEKIFGEVSFIESKINFLNLDNGFILISCARGFERKVVACLSVIRGLISVGTFGTIRRCRRVMKEWSSKLWDMTGL